MKLIDKIPFFMALVGVLMLGTSLGSHYLKKHKTKNAPAKQINASAWYFVELRDCTLYFNVDRRENVGYGCTNPDHKYTHYGYENLTIVEREQDKSK